MKPTRSIVKAGHAMAAFSRGLQHRAMASAMLVLLLPLISLILITLSITGQRRKAMARQLCIGRDDSLFLLLQFRKPMPEDGSWTASLLRTLERCDLHRLPSLINAARGEVTSFGDVARPWPPLAVETGQQHASERLRGFQQ